MVTSRPNFSKSSWKVLGEQIPPIALPNKETKQKNKNIETESNKQTTQNNMIVGLLSVNDRFAVHASELLLTCFQGSTSACIKLAQVQCKRPISHYIKYHYMTTGNTRNAVRTSMKLLLNILGRAKMAQQLKKKNSHWHDIFLMIKHGIAGDRLVRACSNGSLPSLRPLDSKCRRLRFESNRRLGRVLGRVCFSRKVIDFCIIIKPYKTFAIFHRAPVPGATWRGSFMGPALGEKMVKSWLFFNNPRGCWDDCWSVGWSEIGVQKLCKTVVITNMVADLKGRKGLFSKSHPSWGMKPHET